MTNMVKKFVKIIVIPYTALQPTRDKRVELPQFTGDSNANVGRDDAIRRA
jgi:hypothetical protein